MANPTTEIPFDDNPSSNEYPEDFATSIASDIGKELFSASQREPSEKPEGTTPTASVAKTGEISPAPNEAAVAAANVAAQNPVPTYKPLPKSWKKDMEGQWAKLDPAVHDYVYAREADVMRGIQQYQSGHDSWNNLVKPFEPVLQQYPDVNPVQLLQNLMNSHLYLLNPQVPAAEKQQAIQRMMAQYGVSLSDQPAGTTDPRIDALTREVQSLRRSREVDATRQYQANIESQTKIVEAFASDPKNKHFLEVANDIHRFIQSGAATDLASAYELAIWANPAVREKMQAEQLAAASAQNGTIKPRGANGQFRNIDAIDPSKTSKTKSTMEETIERVAKEAFSRH
jgi:hypothetical protein